jgi:hypothetical protein
MGSGGSSLASPTHRGGGANRPSPRWLLAGAVALVAVVVAVVVLVTGGGSHPSAASLKYGGIPSWLPSPAPPTNQVVTATPTHPALAAVEGNTVNAQLGGGATAYVTAVGPSIPAWVSSAVQSGNWNDGNTAPSTFTFTFASPHGSIPLKADEFSILTSQGQIVHPAVTGPNGSRLPAQVTPGKPLTLTLKVGLGEGDGALRWAPNGTKVLAAWFYQLELD